MLYVGLEHIEEGKLRLNGIGDSRSIKSNKFIFNENTFLFGKLRPYFRKLIRPKFYGVCSTDIWVVKARAGFDINFLFYLFACKDFVDLASSSSSGTRMPRADWNFMKDTKWNVPNDINEQKAIAGVLSALDDKIDLLRRQNETLEALAQTLFRQWFIEEAESDWEMKPLSFYGKIVCGKTPSKKHPEYFNGEYPFIKIPDMHNITFVFNTSDTLSKEGKEKQDNKSLPEKSICVSCIATVGLVSMNAKICQTNQQINSIVPYKDEYRYFLYLYMKLSRDLLNSLASGGTATLNLNTRDFSRIDILYPGKSILLKFQGLVKGIFEKIFANQVQIHTLEKLRDTLLPKLMSGEVRVRYETHH